MDFGHTADESDFRAHVRRELESPDLVAEVTALRAGGGREPDERGVYRLLGERGLLGVDWPHRYGGQGRNAAHAAIAVEEMMRAGVPDTLFVNGIQTVGKLLLLAGTEEQRRRVLPSLASGRRFASVLYTEPGVGSDLSALTTRAVAVDGGHRISGVKTYNLKSGITDYGLCAARTSAESSRYEGLSLFLVDMRAPGVRVRSLDTMADELFHQVELDGVLVRDDSVVGGIGQGWGVLAEALPLERTGFDFALRAERWFAAGAGGPGPAGHWLADIGRHGAATSAARLLAWRCVGAADLGQLDELRTATAKWYASEQAAAVARWATERHGFDAAPELAELLDSAYREAPGLTLSGGTSEMMLQTISSFLLAAEATTSDVPEVSRDATRR
ncbi:acyl-CoA dehydrogenase family protein [Streptomyces sp. SPB162]|uniref:acyl-CoA dehydrogenase family protein n=1 Tax=Streptomyces sp. SPB162 TaxID=2940560 RepID=UPI0024058AFD|nr:acyl-CoA dehydrogenase family protein [Streptomyces sp. SPB162]MDF9815300.1 alkylation response protein AidB-like acyl-CoA dehydrogenase [Streptomyces sp. SPB162]